jgi:hypothetical protein
LKNRPKIGGNTLIGDKSASDLGLATETALADKADKSAVKNEFIGTLDEWNALTIEQRKAYDTYQIKGDYTEGSGGLPDYSTTEQKTGQKWIDNSDIWFKTVDIGALPNSTYKNVQTGITNVKDICKIEGITTNETIYTVIPHGANTASYGVELSFNKQDNTVRVFTSEDQSTYTGIVTLYYTKTT